MDARTTARQRIVRHSIRSLPSRRLFLVGAWTLLACFVASISRADLTFDLRAVSGSQVLIHNPKSVAVNHNSIGGWVDFELYAFVNGANATANDESIHSFAGNMLSTHIGHGAAGGSMINYGEIAPRVRRGVVPPLDYFGSDDGWLQNLDGDSDLEIGGTGWALDTYGDWQKSGQGMIAGRGDPFRVRNYEGEAATAEFLLYRLTLPIESFPAQGLSDMTSVYFSPGPLEPLAIWFHDGVPQSNRYGRGGVINFGSAVLIHTAHTPEELALIPEPGTWLLALGALIATTCLVIRRRS
jgi:hypothetical protein